MWAGLCLRERTHQAGAVLPDACTKSPAASPTQCLSCFSVLYAAIGATMRTILARASTQLSVAADGSVVYGTSSSNGSSSSGGGKVNVLNNLDWFGPMSFLDFLRDVGKYARVGQMLAKDSVSETELRGSTTGPGHVVCRLFDGLSGKEAGPVARAGSWLCPAWQTWAYAGLLPLTASVVVLQVRSRMESESGISFTEFTYQLLQGYDFVHLARNHRVRMQVGVLAGQCAQQPASLDWHTAHTAHPWTVEVCQVC